MFFLFWPGVPDSILWCLLTYLLVSLGEVHLHCMLGHTCYLKKVPVRIGTEI